MTDRCSASCRICCFCCSPKNKNVISEELMLRIIDQAKEQNGIEYIGFSGGEPFLYYDLLKKGLLYAKKRGFKTSVATNGFWGRWPDETLENRLGAFPVDQMTISTDCYHQQYIPEQDLKKAISAARAANINLKVGIGETKSGMSSGDFFGTLGSYKYLMSFYTYPLVRAGRARELPENDFFRYEDSGDVRCNPMGLVAVRFDGEVYPCCEQMVFETGLSMGNIHDRTLRDILSDPCDGELFSLLVTKDGLNSIIKIAEEKLGFKKPERCSGGCELCGLLFHDREAVEKLKPYIAEEYGKAVVSELLSRT